MATTFKFWKCLLGPVIICGENCAGHFWVCFQDMLFIPSCMYLTESTQLGTNQTWNARMGRRCPALDNSCQRHTLFLIHSFFFCCPELVGRFVKLSNTSRLCMLGLGYCCSSRDLLCPMDCNLSSLPLPSLCYLASSPPAMPLYSSLPGQLTEEVIQHVGNEANLPKFLSSCNLFCVTTVMIRIQPDYDACACALRMA